jgi:hypothetical protein
VTIAAAAHPLAAGLSGKLEVTFARSQMGFGIPGPGALRIATLSNDKERATVFAYERGAAMLDPAWHAPARRMGLFLHWTGARLLTDAGWALLDAAVRWAVADARP